MGIIHQLIWLIHIIILTLMTIYLKDTKINKNRLNFVKLLEEVIRCQIAYQILIPIKNILLQNPLKPYKKIKILLFIQLLQILELTYII
jgi:hypothetical protein